MRKKILTLDDLVKFCQEKKLYSFSSKETGYKLSVSVPASFEKEDKEESSLLFVKVKCFHTGKNRNGSNVTLNAAKKAMQTMAYKPILANFMTDEDGNMDFTSHDFIINDDGEIEYLEHQIGCFTTDKPYMEQDSENQDRQYIYATAAIPREYTAAADIIERKNGTKVSVELAVNEMSYDSKEKVLLLEDIEVSGLTCIGTNPETGEPVQEGMEGARLDIADFSTENNSFIDKTNFEIMQGLKESLDNYIAAMSAVNSKKGGHKDMVFDENVEVTGTSEEEVVEQEAAETEVVEGAETTEESTEEVADTEAESEETEDVTPSEDEVKMSVKIGGEVKEFSVSLKDKLNALYTLVNETYGETDNDYYDVDVYDDEKVVVMHGWCKGTHYRQSYSVKKDVYSLKGDRAIVRACWLTQDEETKLNEMKSNYSSIQEKLDKYEAEPEKIELLNSEGYNGIKTTEEYSELAKRETYFDMNKDELAEKLDQIVLKYAKAGELQFVAKQDVGDKVGMKKLPIVKPKRSGRYGGLFSKK